MIVWVVDSADADGLVVARGDMTNLLSNPSLRRIPCLVLGNKSDVESSLSTQELRERLVPDGDGDAAEREIHVLKTSCLNGDGIKDVITWLGKKAR